jgi:bacteriocin biosynthesis cyclodehydratase domain-containing protein
LWTAYDGLRESLAGSHRPEVSAVRPQLKPALPRLWRDPTTLQLGLDPQRALVLSGVDVADLGVLELLDGRRAVEDVVEVARRRGHDTDRVRELVSVLLDAAALDDADVPSDAAGSRIRPVSPASGSTQEPDLLSLSLLHRPPGAATRVMRRRRATTVEVLGAGRVGATVATLLAAAGIGHLDIDDDGPVRAADVSPGGLRGAGGASATRGAETRRLLSAVTTTRGRPVAASPAVSVLAPTTALLAPELLGRTRDRPHLPVLVRETTAVIGPLVVPGRTPCCRCVELARGDRDPAWPSLSAQLLGSTRRVEPCDVVLATLAASFAVAQLLAFLDDADTQPPALGAVLEIGLADLRLRRRTVRPYPGCGCGAGD